MKEQGNMFKDPDGIDWVEPDDDLDLREISPDMAVSLFARALDNFGLFEPEATRVAKKIFLDQEGPMETDHSQGKPL